MSDEPYPAEKPAGVFVTLADIYVKLTAIELAVSPLPAKVDDHELRIRSLEKARWLIAGFCAAAGGGAGAALSKILGG